MSSPKEFLAEEVLVEKKVITYRYLSRALKVHVNVAKRALFDFHTAQNAKKAGSLHATYLLYGTKTGDGTRLAQNGGSTDEDIDMEDDLLPDYLQSDRVATTTITLVAEENLESALAQYETLEAIHVYSVSPQPMSDLQLLSDATRQLRELRGASTPEDSAKTFGTIPNSHVRRRQRKGQAPIAATAAPAPAATPSSVFAKATSKAAPAADAPGPKSIWNKVNAAKDKDDSKPAPAADSATPEAKDTKDAQKPTAAASSSATAAPPALKRAGSSGGGGIMQAFAKGANAPKPKKREPLPAVVKKPAEEDTAMGMSDDGGDEGNDEDVIPKAQQVVGGKSRQERQEELRKMMEEDDEEDAEDEKDEDEREDTPMEDVEDEKPAEPAAPAKDEGPSEVVTASSGDGRRRGKRRVMRKKMIEDKDGYLVTIQEPGWESFSEDEAPPKAAPVSASPAASAASSSAKAKKPAPKTGQGSIMSFFGKK